jgi:hypothetical protein
VVNKQSNQLSEHQAEFVMLATVVMGFLLEDAFYFHPETINCFLSILAILKGE